MPAVSVIVVSMPVPSGPIMVESESALPEASLFELHAATVKAKHAEINVNFKIDFFMVLIFK
jgi:hypothetical protein